MNDQDRSRDFTAACFKYAEQKAQRDTLISRLMLVLPAIFFAWKNGESGTAAFEAWMERAEGLTEDITALNKDMKL